MAPNIDTTSHTSQNYDDRPGGVKAVVLHSGEGTKESDLSALTAPNTKKSAHYYIDRAGRTYQLVPPEKRAWHAGASEYLGLRSWNDFAVGIESEHRKGQNWPPAQRDAFRALCQYLMARFGVPNAMIVAHRWIAITAAGAHTRKEDPTDWPDAELRPWIASLRPEADDPLRAATLPGVSGGVYYCGIGFRDFYHQHGGAGLFGYAETDEQEAIGLNSIPCTWLRTERAVLKYIEGVGVHLALLSEARMREWI